MSAEDFFQHRSVTERRGRSEIGEIKKYLSFPLSNAEQPQDLLYILDGMGCRTCNEQGLFIRVGDLEEDGQVEIWTNDSEYRGNVGEIIRVLSEGWGRMHEYAQVIDHLRNRLPFVPRLDVEDPSRLC